VDDESTAILMKSFYGHMNEGLDKAKALREAKIEMIRSTGLKRNPFYWGPFILIGDSRRADIR
jgi:CHAT domain-containing protein